MSKKIDSKKLPKIAVHRADEEAVDTGTNIQVTKSATSPAGPKISLASSTKAKETVYVDVDDEITSVIEKVIDSKSDIVALVLPKRAAVLQSIVNMKLLKRSADQKSKNLVLVTSEASVLPLAGIVGLHVAPTPTSKPVIPPAPKMASEEPEQIEEPSEDTLEDEDEFDKEAAQATPVGSLAAMSKEPESIELPDEDPLEGTDDKPNVVPVKKRDKGLAIPNFDSFRKKIALAILGVILLGGLLYAALVILPHATIRIASETSTVDSNFSMTLNTNAKALDEVNKILPAVAQTVTKTGSQTAPATGQQNNGEKATGRITITNCTDDTISVPAGTSFTRDGRTFSSTESASVQGSDFTSGGNCKENGKRTIDVVAIKGGAASNIGAGAHIFSGSSSSISAYGSSMTGGTDAIVKVVAQADIDAAKAKVASQNADQIKQELATGLKAKSQMPIPTTFVAGEEQITPSVEAGDRADSVSVTVTTQYSMLGIQREHLKTIILGNVKKQIDDDKQKVLQDGIDTAQFSQEAPASATNAVVAVKTKSVAGPFIEIAEVKRKAAGKKEASIRGDLQEVPGITDVEVKYSPFWVSMAPRDVKKITVELDKVTD